LSLIEGVGRLKRTIGWRGLSHETSAVMKRVGNILALKRDKEIIHEHNDQGNREHSFLKGHVVEEKIW